MTNKDNNSTVWQGGYFTLLQSIVLTLVPHTRVLSRNRQRKCASLSNLFLDLLAD